MLIDCRLQQRDQLTSGLVMELIPGLAEDEAARARAIFIGEDAFGFIEPAIARHWPPYGHYGHWGISAIPVATWVEIVADFRQVRASLLMADHAAEVKQIGFIFDEVEQHFRAHFEEIRVDIADMIAALDQWLAREMPVCTHISILGI